MSASPSRTSLLEDPQLRPFLPLLWVAWADGDLEDEELTALRERVHEMPWLRPAARLALEEWLTPARAPTAREMRTLLTTIEKVSGTLAPERRGDLVELGMSLADAKDGESKEVRGALEQLQGALWGDSSSPVFPPPTTAPAPAEVAPVQLTSLRQRLDGDDEVRVARDAVRKFLDDPDRRAYGLPVPEYRALAAKWLQAAADQGMGKLAYPGVTTKEKDLTSLIATFETLAFGDLSLTIKFGVQFGLFGGSIYFLGSDAQRQKHLPHVASGALPGCFAMSEVGHGSDVDGLETLATWDKETRTFLIQTPRESARKDWVGGAAQFAQMATVFAKLRVGEDDHGVHAFLVPIRSKDGTLKDGVRAGDSGHKMGLNGVDNGRLWFDNVRVPEDAMLARFARFDAAGEYESEIQNPKKRFFTMLGTLVGGRICVAGASVSAAKVGLAIAIRYAAKRRQFGGEEGIEVPLLSYPTHERRLLPHLASTYVMHFAIEGLRKRFAEQVRSPANDSREIEAAAAALKTLASWHAVKTVEECRQACGGQGYLSVNRLPELRADIDIFTTFEGDNTVLLQLVAKSLLSGYRKRFESKGIGGILRFVMTQAVNKTKTAVTEKNVLAVRRTDSDHLRDREFHLAAFRFREERLLETAAARLRKRLGAKMNPHAAMMEVQEHLVLLARAHSDRIALEWFDEAVKETKDESVQKCLSRLGALHALTRMQEEGAFYLSEGYLEPAKDSAIRDETITLLREIREHAVGLVDAFGIPDACLAAPIAFMDPAHPKW